MKRTLAKSFFLTAILVTAVQAALAQAPPEITQSIDCTDPVPESIDFACADNWGLDRIDLAYPDDTYRYRWTGQGVHAYVLDTGIHVAGNAGEFGGRVEEDYTEEEHLGQLNYDDCSANGHGTRVASVIGGSRYGVAKDVTLHLVKYGYGCNVGNILGFISSLEFIRDDIQEARGLDPNYLAIVNISTNIPKLWHLGNFDNTRMCTTDSGGQVLCITRVAQLVDEIIDLEVPVVVAAGNYDNADGLTPSSFTPSDVPRAFVIGGVDRLNARWQIDQSDPDYEGLCNPGLPQPNRPQCGSNYGPEIDLWAPAEFIFAATNPDTDGSLVPSRGVLSGTSFAAPHVTGAIALYMEKFRAENGRGPTVDEVWTLLETNAACGVLTGIGNGSPNLLLNTYFQAGPCPIASDDSVTTPSSTLLPILYASLRENDQGQGLSVVLGGFSDPPHGTITVCCNPAGFKYTSDPGYVGSDSFTYTVVDEFDRRDTAVVHVTVTNRPPVAVNDVATTNQDVPVTIAVLANDSDPDGHPLTVQVSDSQVVVNPNKTVTYTPAAGFTGTKTFPYTINDGHGGEDPATVTVTVSSPNTAPSPCFNFTCTNLLCSFDANCSTDDHGIASYSWSFGDSTFGSGGTTSHSFPAKGSYTVTLTVTDTGGLQSSTSKKVSVTDEIPAAAEGFFTVPPCRIADTRNTTPLTSGVQRLFQVTGLCGIPASAKAVSFNATVVSPTGGGHLVFLPGNQTSGPFAHSTHNFDPANSPRANNGIVRLATNSAGSINVAPFVSGSPGQVHLILDVYGYFSEDAAPAPGAQGPFGFQTVTPCRIADTRTGSPIAVNTTHNFTVQGVCGVPSGAAAAPFNLTIISPTAGGHAPLFQAGISPGIPVINFNAGVVLTNGARIRLAPTTPDVSMRYFSPTGGSSTHATLDVFGYFKTGAPLKYRSMIPCRAVDTRFADQGGPLPLGAPETRNFQIRGNCGVPTSAKAVAVNITTVGSAGPGYLIAYPSGGAAPAASYLTFEPGQGTLGNGGIVALSTLANDLAITSANSTHVIIDVFGYFQ